MLLLVVFSSYRTAYDGIPGPMGRPLQRLSAPPNPDRHLGRGEWFGVGLGASVQKLFYLPEAHTDFLFAVLAEGLGLFGVARPAGAYFWHSLGARS